MTLQPATRAEFEEGLREDGIQQPEFHPAPVQGDGGMAKRAASLLGSSVADCRSSLECGFVNSPANVLQVVVYTLEHMAAEGIQRETHRKELVRIGRKAITALGEAAQ